MPLREKVYGAVRIDDRNRRFIDISSLSVSLEVVNSNVEREANVNPTWSRDNPVVEIKQFSINEL